MTSKYVMSVIAVLCVVSLGVPGCRDDVEIDADGGTDSASDTSTGTDSDTDTDTDADTDSGTDECDEGDGFGECPDAGALLPTEVTADGAMLGIPVSEECALSQSLCDETGGLTCYVLEQDTWGTDYYAIVTSDADSLAAVVDVCPDIVQVPDEPDWGAQQLVLIGGRFLYDTVPLDQIHMDYRLSEYEDGQVHVDMYEWSSMGGSMDSDLIFVNAFALVDTEDVPTVCLFHHFPCD
jgi:hypothetical protein